MLKLRTLTVTAIAGRFSHSSGIFGHRRARLAGKYRWQEFPVVITGNYHPGKYSKFWQSGKYWEIRNHRAV